MSLYEVSEFRRTDFRTCCGRLHTFYVQLEICKLAVGALDQVGKCLIMKSCRLCAAV